MVILAAVAVAERPRLPGTVVPPDFVARALGALHILDATVELPAARFDGDHRAASGRTAYLDGHIPGARHADLLGAFSESDSPHHFRRPSLARLEEALRSVGIEDGRPVVCYDTDGGIWAARLCYQLQASGVSAAVLDGGFEGWRLSKRTTAAGDETASPPPEGSLVLEPGDSFWAEKDEVAEIATGSHSGSLVCALSAEAFAGTIPSRYSRRGHIPRSTNVPARSILSHEGRWPSPADLRERLAEVLSLDGPLISYCGGGVSAAVLALALRLAGRKDVKVYDGSLEEWSADPRSPLELGAP